MNNYIYNIMGDDKTLAVHIFAARLYKHDVWNLNNLYHCSVRKLRIKVISAAITS